MTDYLPVGIKDEIEVLPAKVIANMRTIATLHHDGRIEIAEDATIDELRDALRIVIDAYYRQTRKDTE